MKSNRGILFLGILLGLALGMARVEAQGGFPLKEGDTWVMAGDSITAQHLHSNYFEAFCYARFPQQTFRFRNSGVGGDTIPRVLARFDWDVAAWKPTVVSVELGMNDAGAGPDSAPRYIEQMGTLAQRIRAVGARPVFLAASAVNDGTSSKRLSGRNVTLDRYATALKEFAAKDGAPFADQFHALLDVWGRNKPFEELHRSAAVLAGMAANSDLPANDPMRQWLEAWQRSDAQKRGINLTGDPVHPGPAGQLMMAAALLQDLQAPRLVSEASVDATGKVGKTVQCRVTDARAENGGISFTRLDECLPMPIPDDARGALLIYPPIAGMSRWMLTVTGLPAGGYDVAMDGVQVATVSAAELAKGWNLGTLEKGPVADQGREILKLVAAKEGLVGQWRGLSRNNAAQPTEQGKADLEKLAAQILEADARIREAAQPKPHRFTIAPAQLTAK